MCGTNESTPVLVSNEDRRVWFESQNLSLNSNRAAARWLYFCDNRWCCSIQATRYQESQSKRHLLFNLVKPCDPNFEGRSCWQLLDIGQSLLYTLLHIIGFAYLLASCSRGLAGRRGWWGWWWGRSPSQAWSAPIVCPGRSHPRRHLHLRPRQVAAKRGHNCSGNRFI